MVADGILSLCRTGEWVMVAMPMRRDDQQGLSEA
jgi:hypothetical protein